MIQKEDYDDYEELEREEDYLKYSELAMPNKSKWSRSELNHLGLPISVRSTASIAIAIAIAIASPPPQLSTGNSENEEHEEMPFSPRPVSSAFSIAIMIKLVDGCNSTISKINHRRRERLLPFPRILPSRVDETLYRVPKSGFFQANPKFFDRFNVIELNGVTSEVFEGLLNVFHPINGNTLTYDGWLGALELATRWNMPEIRAGTICQGNLRTPRDSGVVISPLTLRTLTSCPWSRSTSGPFLPHACLALY
ncbi:hypothetical protein CPB83DRAFT_900646 [Crepidotus variabilis]|uniref:BTB domain-containing protein n=1 Tax=Crepidotus variabilis TaxID=179855 RepID=A0A9P6BE25_9AGAR|nr:hypothetical protein CPB83DRAFT_900646 [Crepidotus variabilis]